jgi:hypothetical protein
MVASWCPPNSEVHGLALHGQAVRFFFFVLMVSGASTVKRAAARLARPVAVARIAASLCLKIED